MAYTQQNSYTHSLSVTLTPSDWAGKTGQTVNFEAKAYDAHTWPGGQDSWEVTDYATFAWSASIGNLVWNRNRATFYAPDKEAKGQVTVTANKPDHNQASASATIIVCATEVLPDKTCATSSISDTTQTTTQKKTATQTQTATAAPSQSLETCLKEAVGEERFLAISSGASRPTLTEYEKGLACFEKLNLSVAAPFSPLVPKYATVKALAEEPETLLANRPSNQKEQTPEGTEVLSLLFAGKASPNTAVWLFIFSTPLVLETKTDSLGNWRYSLKDPLEPGQHQLFVVMKKADGEFVRSAPVLFEIARAAETADNPTGASLALETPEPERSSLLYLYASGAIVLLGGLAVMLLLRYRRRLAAVAES